MKYLTMIVVAISVLLVSSGCEIEDDPDSTGLNEQELNPYDGDTPEPADCAAPNRLFGTTCCSPEGTVAGQCKFDREWISESDCKDDYWIEGVQYCCGGTYLPAVGAYGFQCTTLD